MVCHKSLRRALFTAPGEVPDVSSARPHRFEDVMNTSLTVRIIKVFYHLHMYTKKETVSQTQSAKVRKKKIMVKASGKNGAEQLIQHARRHA